LTYEVERSLKEFGDKVDPAERSKVEAAVREVRSQAEKGDTDQIKRAMDELNRVWQGVAAAMYQQASQPGDAGADASSSTGPQGRRVILRRRVPGARGSGL